MFVVLLFQDEMALYLPKQSVDILTPDILFFFFFLQIVPGKWILGKKTLSLNLDNIFIVAQDSLCLWRLTDNYAAFTPAQVILLLRVRVRLANSVRICTF